MPDGSQETKTRRLNPEMHIPEAASAIHHIYDQDVADCPTFQMIAKSLWSYIEGCDLAGYNSNKFDIPVLVEEFLRAGIDVDLKNAVSSTCRTFSTRWNNARWSPHTNSTARKT